MSQQPPFRLVASGCRGMIGGSLIEQIKRGVSIRGRQVVVNKLIRSETGEEDGILYDAARGYIDAKKLEGCDAVVHLAGESLMGPIGGGDERDGWRSGSLVKWTPEKCEEIRNSRVVSTRMIAQALKGLEKPPSTFLCASGVGFYGSQDGDEEKGESHGPGTGFLAELSKAIEKEANEAKSCSQVCSLRFGAVLSARGGMLKGMLPSYQMRVGGPFGSGEQWLSWISLQDAVRAILFLLEHPAITGPVNVTSPNPLRNRDFTTALHEQLHPSAWFLLNAKTPATALRWLFGDVTDELFLASQRIIPALLEESGFVFDHPDVSCALKWATQDIARTVGGLETDHQGSES